MEFGIEAMTALPYEAWWAYARAEAYIWINSDDRKNGDDTEWLFAIGVEYRE